MHVERETGGRAARGDLAQRVHVGDGIGVQAAVGAWDGEGQQARGVQVDIIPRLFEALGPSARMNSLEGVQLVSLPPTRMSRDALFLKHAFDFLGASLLLLVRRRDLEARTRTLIDAERRRFTDLLEALEVDQAGADRLRAAARRVDDLRFAAAGSATENPEP